MTTLYQSDYKKILWDDANQVIVQNWIDTSKMSETDLRNELLEYRKHVEAKKPDGIVSIAVNFKYSIHPDLQGWIGTEIIGAFIKAGVRRYAQVVSPDLFAQVSIEQTLEDVAAEQFQTRYFESQDEALAWIKESRVAASVAASH
jgi:hypothetical protein